MKHGFKNNSDLYLKKHFLLFLCLIAGGFLPQAQASDSPQWGHGQSRNMVSNETGLPSGIDPQSGKNVKWSVSIGSHNYSTPVIARGKVLIGANNADVRDSRHQGDRGTLLCLNESDGSLCWQLLVPRVGGDRHNDWPMISLCSTSTVEGEKIYVLTNRSEVLCLDLNGQTNGNDGTFQGENWYVSPHGDFSYEITPKDADILWMFDMRLELGMCPHDSPEASILIDGDVLYLNTSNGVDFRHLQSACLEAPALIALDKHTGRLLAKDNERFGPRTFHSAWASPSMGRVKGNKLLFFGGPDGVVYAFKALKQGLQPNANRHLKKIWSFDCDPGAPKTNIHDYLHNRREGPSLIYGMPVFYKNRIYVTAGGDIWWGKRSVWLKCIDATLSGDITSTGELWSTDLEDHSAATPAISNGLVYVTDCGNNIQCIDAESGMVFWTHKMKGDSWSSVLAADGKIFVGSRRGDFWILKQGREKVILDLVQLDSAIHSTAVAANGVLYVATMERLYAFEQK